MQEIRRTIQRYGAVRFAHIEEPGSAVIMFEMFKRRLKFVLPLPDSTADEFKMTPGGRRERNSQAIYKAWEQACRQRWRALALAIKAKLEVVETGIASFDEEFASYVVLPDGKTVGEHILSQIQAAYSSGKMPKLLLAAN